MTREEPSLETLWLRNKEMMEKVQKIDHSDLGSFYIEDVVNYFSRYSHFFF
jgi:hypothetical protein